MRFNSNSFRYTAFVLAVTVLLSSLGVTVGVHFCQDNIKDLQLFAKAESCFGMVGDGQCEAPSNDLGNSISKKKCCTNTSISAKATFLLDQISTFTSSFDILGITQIPSLETLFNQIVEQNNQFDHGPPNYMGNAPLRILLQTFLL